MKRISPSTQGSVGAGKHHVHFSSYACSHPRILVFSLLLALTPGIAQAWGCGCCEGVHYSPYAFSYYNSGLVPGYVTYSPYAFSYSHPSGLIDECTQYTPYALSYNSSGLVPDYGICPGYSCAFTFPVFGPHGFCPRPLHRTASVVRGHVQAPPKREPPHPGTHARPSPGHCDALTVIRQHLRAKGFASACVDRILRVDNQLVSVDFLVPDRNLLIKYWNPQELEQLGTKKTYQQTVCANYRQDWDRYSRHYKEAGGEIYTISASEPAVIVAALDACTKLSPGLDAPAQTTLYAKEQ